MATIPPNPNTSLFTAIAPYLPPVLSPANLNYLFAQTNDLFHEQSKHLVFVGVGLSAIGTAYSALFNNANQWVFYASGCAVCLGTAYHQGWLEQALYQAQAEITRLQKSLTVAETALSDRELLLKDLKSTKERLKETSDTLVTAGINERNLITELATTREKQKELSDTVAQMTVIVSFFQNLKETYPDPKVFLEHLASIEKVTKVTQAHLAQHDTATATKMTELMTYFQGFDKRGLDQMALLLEMNKDITTIKKGVRTANTSLDELKKSNVA